MLKSMKAEEGRDFPPGERRRRPAQHMTEPSDSLGQREQIHSESDPWQYGTGPGTMISPNLRSPGQAETPLSSIWQHPLRVGLSSWLSSGLHDYTSIRKYLIDICSHVDIYAYIDAQISQVSHKIFLKAALMTNLSHIQLKKATAHMAEC